jgi:hypothetical protein
MNSGRPASLSAMRTIVVRYETKPERAEDNVGLVEAVFAQLNGLDPGGFGYATFRLEDGNTFIHIVRETSEGAISLNELSAFRAFTENVGERCLVPPDAKGATVVGSYNFFAD